MGKVVVIDEYARECLAIEAGRTFTARDVMLALQHLFAVRGAPEHIRSDNGPELIAKEIQRVPIEARCSTLYVQKASPWEICLRGQRGRQAKGRVAESGVAPEPGRGAVRA